MKGTAKAIVLLLAAVAIGGGAFWGGMLYQKGQQPEAFALGDGQGMRGGPFANLSEEQQAEIESMSDEERRAWMEENAGAPGAGQGGPVRGGALEGEVIEIAGDTITVELAAGGSQTFYTDEDTVFAYAEGAAELTAGASVMVMATPSADAVTTATLIVVR